MTANDDSSRISRVFQSKAETRAYYNKIAKAYDLLAERAEQPIRQKGLAKLAVRRGESILEIGSGTGHCLVELAETVGADGRVYGIDISEAMLSLSRKLLVTKGLADRATLTCGDAEHLPYADGSLDGVFISFTLELFDTPEIPSVLAQCRRVLKSGGRLAVVALSKEGKQGLIIKAYEWTHEHFPNLLDCRPIYARRSVEAAGFEVREVATERMWVPVEIVLAARP